ncbi:MAG: efflux RND transporter periplasmic adaptor subunit, partial [Gemmatimonadetes bacterium]|nr:efflux RND transporter periplasmic adaptor subunit [Gemmatimonadota bacterium]
MKTRTQIVVTALLVVAAAALVGWRVQEDAPAENADAMEGHDHSAMAAGSDTQSPVRLSPDDARRIGVTFATAERRSLEIVVEALGTVGYDETRLAAVNPKIEAWIERLHVDFTGATVTEGQPMMDVYSPMLVSAQEELTLAARLLRDAPEGRAQETARTLLESARRRLSYWDVPADEIARIEESGTVSRTLTLHAPAGGVVVEKNVVEGDRIMPGMTLFRVADLSRVWIEADVFEKDLGLMAEGQRAVATFESLPGRTFEARVTYVYPTVSMESRTGRVRLELRNPRGELKPGMYAKVRLEAPAQTPEVVVPRAAVLSTGTRALVFVRADDG